MKDISKLAEERFPDIQGHWPEENQKQSHRRDGFIAGYLAAEQEHLKLKEENANMEKNGHDLLWRYDKLKEALIQIEQFSDPGSYALAVVQMKAIATEVLKAGIKTGE